MARTRSKKLIKKQNGRNENYAVGYCRYSSERQGEATIEAQQRAIKAYAEQNGIKIMNWYIDRAQSGKDDKRPDFLRMANDMEQNDWGKILVHKVDRFSRSIFDFLKYEMFYQAIGIDTVFTAQPEMNNKIMKILTITFAEMFLDNLSLEVTKGMIENAHKGKRNGGNIPYGYDLVKVLDELGNQLKSKSNNPIHTVAINPEQAEAVKIMFNMTLEGYTRADIIKVLDDMGYKRVSQKGQGQSFVGTSIDNILRNERYTGEYDFNYNSGTRDKPKYDTIRVTDEFPQIISRETFEAVQKILATRKHRPPSNALEDYLLTGKIVCGESGHRYQGVRRNSKGKKYIYYQCADQKSYNNGTKLEKGQYCNNNKVRQDQIEPFVIERLKEVVFNENFIDQVYEQYNNFAREQSVNNSMLEMLQNKLEDIDTKNHSHPSGY